MRRVFLFLVAMSLLIGNCWARYEYYGTRWAYYEYDDNEIFNYLVQPGDCLWKIAERAGAHGTDYEFLVLWNPDVFVRRSPDLIFPGEYLCIEDIEWAYNLGLIELSAEQPSFNQVGQEPIVVIASSVTPVKSGFENPVFWFFVIFLLAIIILIWRGDRIRDWIIRAVRELIYALMPLKLDPVYAGGIGLVYASDLFGVRPEDLVLSPVSGTYRTNHRKWDGSAYSLVSSVRGEEAYHLPGDTSLVVFSGCGNEARRLSSQQRVTTQLAEAARTGFRPKTPLEPVQLQDNYRFGWDWMGTEHDLGVHGYLDEEEV